MQDAPKKYKNQYWQAIRGLAIVAVVLIHCSNLADSENFFTLEGIYYILFRNFINFPVALFFCVSGYFTSFVGGIQLKKKIKRLLVPYFVWTLFYILLRFLMGETITIHSIILFFVLGKAAVPLYFIVALFFANLIAPIFIKLINGWAKYLIFIVIAILMLIQYFVYYYNIALLKPYFKYVIFIGFYYLGIMLKNIDIKVSIKKAVFLLIVSFIFEIIESLLILRSDISDFAFGQTRVTAFMYAFAVVLLCYSLKNTEIKSRLGLA